MSATKNGWRLALPAGPEGAYRLAQLDDYTHLSRRRFPWRPPLSLRLKARASNENLPGTWGFGLWNDPFSLSFGIRGTTRRFPDLPNTAWFFYASAPNYLSLRDDLPAQGPLAATFRAPRVPAALLAPAAPTMPFLLWPPTARLMRRLARRAVGQDSTLIPPMLPATARDVPPLRPAAGSASPSPWRRYRLDWRTGQAVFSVDGRTILDTPCAPREPLGLVVWVDNQYAAFTPDGRLAYGTLPNARPAWIEISALEVLKG